MIQKHIAITAQTLGLRENSVRAAAELLEEGATIPFIARYRKEKTGSLDEVQLADIQKQLKRLSELEARKLTILSAIEEQGKLTSELLLKIQQCFDHNELEDIYLPYKKKKKTKADVARELGLEPLAKMIMSQRGQDIFHQAQRFLNDSVLTIPQALQGAKDIIAEWVSEDQEIRDRLRQQFRKFAEVQSKVVAKKKEEAEKYLDYFDFKELLHRCPSHRFLAMMRGDNEGMLKLSLLVDNDRAMQGIERKYIRSNGQESELIAEAIADSYKRLIFPGVETQILNEFKDKADDEAIRVFRENLRQLLLSAPLGQKSVLAIDPGYRTGCKVVCLDSNGDFLEYKTIYPHAPQNQSIEAKEVIRHLVYKHDIQAIAIGNGTASRETRDIVESMKFDRHTDVYMVSESGASVYSASDVAREEFPDKDVTVRGAISIGRRLMDPLAELVKIDPKSIGVGQYQHDVNQTKLKENLDITVSSCVNAVGVNINTASKHILTYIAGLGPTLAKNILEYRRTNGNFTDIQHLKKVPRLGEKAFEQAAGFLRIKDGSNPLDDTGVHPEAYDIVHKMASDSRLSLTRFIKDKDIRKNIVLQDYVNEKAGIPTLTDIMKELDKPGLDPRGQARSFAFDTTIKVIDDVRVGMVIPGLVTNLTNFGAFVDIGVKQDGLLHISQISHKFIRNPDEVLSLGQELTVKVIGIDIDRKRINLSLFI